MRINIFDAIVAENEGWNGVAVRDVNGSHTYPELIQDVRHAAEKLQSAGVREYDRCAFIADDSYPYIVWSLAVLSLDAAIVPLSTRAVRSEWHEMAQRMNFNYVIAQKAYCSHPDGVLDTEFVFRHLSEKQEPLIFDGGPAAFIRFSSGTTGNSKGVVLSHGTVLDRTNACKMLAVTRGDTTLWVLDMAYHFVVTILLFLRRGVTIRLCPGPVEDHLAETLRVSKPQLLYATPYHYSLMANSPDFKKEDLAGVRTIISTAMSLSRKTALDFFHKFGLPLQQAYGIIEVGLPCVNTASGTADRAGSVGQLQAAYQIRIGDGTGPAGCCGDIYLRGPGMFDAYLSPYQRRLELFPDGWFATGDVGHTDQDGYVFIDGRSKDVIIFSGMKVFPYEVESVLDSVPGVRESKVYGIPDPSFGEIPAAEVVLFDPEKESDDMVFHLRSECRARLASYKVPVKITFVKDIKRTASGKIIRH